MRARSARLSVISFILNLNMSYSPGRAQLGPARTTHMKFE